MDLAQAEMAKPDSARQGWIYAGKLALACCILLATIVALKFGLEDRLSSGYAGLPGLLRRPSVDLLLIGSSHTRQSYDMRVLERSSGISNAYLCAYQGMDLVSIAQTLELLAQKPERLPRRIVVEAYSNMLATAPNVEDTRYFFDAPPALKLTILREYRATHARPQDLLDLFALMVNRGNDPILAYPFYRWEERNGSYKGGRDHVFTSGVPAERFRAFRSTLASGEANAKQFAALERIVQFGHRFGVELIFIESPQPQAVSADPQVQQLKRKFREVLTAEKMTYIDGDQGFPLADPALFADRNHLSTQGAALFSERIGTVLKQMQRNTVASQ